jgi:sulfite reductase (NADPH) hemoprotein beta-component
MSNEPSPVEKIKADSRFLRGTIVDSLQDPVTGALRESDAQLLKFHGSYQQDHRDVREERRLQKLEPAWSFMVRLRLPGGVCSTKQWLALDDLAQRYANGSLRLTTRQTFQFHGIIKRDLKTAIAAINRALIDTIAACGDVNRNVMASPNPLESAVHAEVYDWARRLSEHLLPRTRAYHEIWLDGEKVEGGPQVEPLYGPVYLPRKFKAGIVVPPHNDIDVLSQDLGFIAIIEHGKLAGFNLTAGGGFGVTHGDPLTYPRLADVIGFLPPQQLLKVGETVLAIQRDFGDRSLRKHARLKYTIDTHGLPWFIEQLATRLGAPLAAPRPFIFATSGDRFGWTQGTDGAWHLTLRIPSGRIADAEGQPWKSGLRAIARIHRGEFRITPNQNLMIAGIAEADRRRIGELVVQYSLDLHETASPVRRDALACVALPTCPLAMAEAERYLPTLLTRLEEKLAVHGLAGDPLLVRMTGCPNGCARPYLAEIGLVGKAPGRYNLHIGGDAAGMRLNTLYRENIDEPAILQALDPLFAAYASDRQAGERFGDFLHRTKRVAPQWTEGVTAP